MRKVTIDIYEFDELPDDVRAKLHSKEVEEQLKWICQGYHLPWVEEELSQIFNSIVAEMERMQTPWFLGQALMGNDAIREAIEYEASSRLKDDYYVLSNGQFETFAHRDLAD